MMRSPSNLIASLMHFQQGSLFLCPRSNRSSNQNVFLTRRNRASKSPVYSPLSSHSQLAHRMAMRHRHGT
eukprot:399552-Karenia_brevis.AAC.1